MFIATADTGNFTFTAAGNSEAEARSLLALGWQRHADATGATMTLAEVLDSVNTVQLVVGDVLRDDSRIYSRTLPYKTEL